MHTLARAGTVHMPLCLPLLFMNSDDENDANVVSVDESTETDLYELLTDPHVRYLLRYLHNHDGPVDLQTAATHVAAGVIDTSPEDVPNDVQNRVQTFLHHGHVPELEAQGIVEYDAEANSIALLS